MSVATTTMRTAKAVMSTAAGTARAAVDPAKDPAVPSRPKVTPWPMRTRPAR